MSLKVKRRNPENRVALVLALILVLTPLIYGGSDHSRLPSQPENVLVFEGTIEKLAPNPGIVSGTIAVYRLARYRVTRVCSGKYEEKEIVIDHLHGDKYPHNPQQHIDFGMADERHHDCQGCRDEATDIGD